MSIIHNTLTLYQLCVNRVNSREPKIAPYRLWKVTKNVESIINYLRRNLGY